MPWISWWRGLILWEFLRGGVGDFAWVWSDFGR